MGWFGGGAELEVLLDGIDAVNAALRKVQPHLRDATVPVMYDIAYEIAEDAKRRLNINHPHNVFRINTRGRVGRPPAGAKVYGRGTYSGDYEVQKVGQYMYCVHSMGGKEGRAQALTEWARLAVTGQGAALVRALDGVYGRAGGSGNGRVLWAAADDIGAGAAQRIQAAVDEAAAAIQSDMGGA